PDEVAGLVAQREGRERDRHEPPVARAPHRLGAREAAVRGDGAPDLLLLAEAVRRDEQVDAAPERLLLRVAEDDARRGAPRHDALLPIDDEERRAARVGALGREVAAA